MRQLFPIIGIEIFIFNVISETNVLLIDFFFIFYEKRFFFDIVKSEVFEL